MTYDCKTCFVLEITKMIFYKEVKYVYTGRANTPKFKNVQATKYAASIVQMINQSKVSL